MIICSNCGRNNPADAKFCQNCGHSLARVCSNCQTANEIEAKFCKNCGNALKTDSPALLRPNQEEKPSRLGEGERRIVTILFCDVVGSTFLGEQLDPEEWTEIMNGVFDRLIAPVTHYEGTVTRLMGDAIMALFGAPVAHEDDPYRAVLAALDMLKELSPYQEKIRRQLRESGLQLSPSDFAVRIGINTGLAVVGDVGTEQALEYTAMGDAVNLAARMEQSASPGTIQITHFTYRLLEQLVEVTPLSPIELKGKKEPVRAYRVLGLNEAPNQVRDLGLQESALIGRQRELLSMKNIADLLIKGNGQILCLIGNAGLGKSRLVQTLKSYMEQSHPRAAWYEAGSLSYETTQPYGLLQRLLRPVGGISRDDPPEIISQKITVLLQDLPPEKQQQFQESLNILFGLVSDSGQPLLQGEELKQALFDCALTLTRTWALVAPTVLVFEDLHWADPASVELIRHLLPLADIVPLLILSVFRPFRRSAAWTIKQTAEIDHPHHSMAIELKPLSDEESYELIGTLLKSPGLIRQLGPRILERTEGNPFFVEETVRDLIERGAVIPGADGDEWQLASEIEATHIPNNLEAVLVARLDRLEINTRQTLQLAAVIGRSFYYRVLTMIADNVEGIDQHLGDLQQAGMIQQSAIDPELEFTFRHTLTHEVAYNTILLRRRRQYHRRTAEIMEQLFSSQLDEHAALLAYHYHQAGENKLALEYHAMAAAKAVRLYANDEAVVHYNGAIDLAGQVSIDPIALVQLHRGRAKAYETIGDFDQAQSGYEAAYRMADTSEDRPLEWQLLLDQGKLWASRDYQQAGQYFERALDLARQMEDPTVLARSLNRMGNWYANAESPREAITRHLEALAIFEKMGDSHRLATTLDLLGMANLLAGNPSSAFSYLDRAISLFREVDNRYGLVSSLTSRGATGAISEFQILAKNYLAQDVDPLLEEAYRVSREIGWLAGQSFVLWMKGLHFTDLGQYDKALESLNMGLQVATRINHRQWMAGGEFSLGLFYIELFAAKEALIHAEISLGLAKEIGSRYWTSQSTGTLAKAYILLGDMAKGKSVLDGVLNPNTPMDSLAKRNCWGRRAEIAIAEGNYSLGLEIVERLIDTQIDLEAGAVIPTLWRLRAEALLGMNRLDEAEPLLQEALESSKESIQVNQLWRSQAALARLLWDTNRRAEAEVLFTVAREEIIKLSETIPNLSLKSNFLQKAIHQASPPSGYSAR